MRSRAIPGALILLFSVVQIAAAAPKPAAPARRLPAPEHIGAEARQQLEARMGQHAVTMESLVRAVVLLDRPTVRVLATRIADEEVVARVTGKGEKQPLLLPPSFFAEQDRLAAAARELAAAAVDDGDDHLLAERFAAVTRTCIGCHSTYLHGRPAAPTPAAPTPAAPTPAAPKPAAR